MSEDEARPRTDNDLLTPDEVSLVRVMAEERLRALRRSAAQREQQQLAEALRRVRALQWPAPRPVPTPDPPRGRPVSKPPEAGTAAPTAVTAPQSAPEDGVRTEDLLEIARRYAWDESWCSDAEDAFARLGLTFDDVDGCDCHCDSCCDCTSRATEQQRFAAYRGMPEFISRDSLRRWLTVVSRAWPAQARRFAPEVRRIFGLEEAARPQADVFGSGEIPAAPPAPAARDSRIWDVTVSVTADDLRRAGWNGEESTLATYMRWASADLAGRGAGWVRLR